MGLSVWKAPPAGGKTVFAVDLVQQTLNQGGLQKIWVLMPDHRQTVVFRKQLLNQGGMLGVDIGRFDALCKEILFAMNQYKPLVPPSFRHRLIQEAVKKARQNNELTYFESIIGLPGFQGMLHSVFNELTTAGVSGQILNQSELESWDLRTQNLLQLYRTYLQTTLDIQWMDPHFLTAYTYQVLSAAAETHWARPDLVVLDGFDRFTQPQLAMIRWLSTYAKRVVITQAADAVRDRAVNQRFARSLQQLELMFPDLEQHWIGKEPYLPPDLKHLARTILNEEVQPMPNADHIRLLAVQSPLEEAREALRWVKQKILTAGCPAEKIAIVIPDEATYTPVLRSVAKEYGLFLKFSQPEVMQTHPAVKTVQSLLTIHQENFARRPLLDLLRSPYLDLSGYGLFPQDAAALDLVSRAGPVIEGLDNWLVILTQYRDEGEQKDISDEESTQYTLPKGDTAFRLSSGLSKLAEDLTVPQDRLPVSDWLAWLAELLEKINWQGCLAKYEETCLAESLLKLFQGLRLGELELGAWRLDFAQFNAVLNGAFGVVTYSKAADPEQDQIQVLRMIEARGVRFDHAVLMGLSEGGFPKPVQDDPFLSNDLRESLGLESKLDQEQASVFYLALTRADKGILITRPYLAPSGETLEASPYWDGLVEVLGEDAVTWVRPEDQRNPIDAASLQELAFWAWSDLCDKPDQPEVRFPRLQHQRDVLAARQPGAAPGIYNGQLENLPAGLSPYVSGDAIWSPSKLETYTTCPYRFWAAAVLNLEEQIMPEPGLQASQLGSILHQILEEVYPAAADPNDPASVLAVLPETAARIFKAAPETYKFVPTPLWEVEQKEYLAAVETAIIELAKDGWQPYAQEHVFGMDEEPALEVNLAHDRKLKVRGIIDRIDRHPDGSMRVVDYKTGSSHQGKDDLLNGTRLQLPLYALAVSEALGLPEPREGFYWALLAKKAGSLKLSRFSANDLQGPQGAKTVLLEHLNQLLDGVSQASFIPKKPEGGCSQYCPARLWCWQYQPERR